MTAAALPAFLDPSPWIAEARRADRHRILAALSTDSPGVGDLAALLSPAASPLLEQMALRARSLTERHFGRTISLYAPLYLSNYCSSGCAYCGFASDVPLRREKLGPEELARELDSLAAMGFEEVLLLTGERTPEAGFEYVRGCVAAAAERFHTVSIEMFPMSREEYASLALAGCTGVSVYQETYDPSIYESIHKWGPKRDYANRLNAPVRALEADMRSACLGVLLGLGEPIPELLSLYLHAELLRRKFWRAGVCVSFPRVRPQRAGYEPPHPVDDRFLFQAICAMRICLPDTPLVLSTRERPAFRDGVAGIGISKMSAASRTTVGGYARSTDSAEGQFQVWDDRDAPTFSAALRAKGLAPVFKDWDRTYRSDPARQPSS